jgi:hypothetical protein
LQEALEQISAIVAEEDDRRKNTDAKLSAAQAAIGFIVALSGGSLALSYLQSPHYDLWRGLVLVSQTVSVGFFVWAAWKLFAASDPSPYQRRIAASVQRMVTEGRTKRELQEDAVKDLVSLADANAATTNKRLTLYRATIENIRKGAIAAACVPLTALIGYGANAAWGGRLPAVLQIATPTPSASLMPTTAVVHPVVPSATAPRKSRGQHIVKPGPRPTATPLPRRNH